MARTYCRFRRSQAADRAYGRLQSHLNALDRWPMLPWDSPAATVLSNLRQMRVRISTHDVRIASIVIANNGLLLTRNLRDFTRVLGLQAEDWLG